MKDYDEIEPEQYEKMYDQIPREIYMKEHWRPLIEKTQKIKVLYLIPQLLTGGTERHLCDLVTHLNSEKFEPVVWCIGQWGPIGDEITSAGIKVINQPLRIYRIDGIIKAFWFVRKGRFDIFHSYSYGSFFIDAIISKVAGVPIYISSRRNIRHWKGGNKLHLGERIRNWISDVIVANSVAVKRKSIEIEKIRPDNKGDL